MHDPITTNHLDENEDNISEDDHTYSLSSSSSTYSSTNDEFIPSPKTSENLIVNNQEEEERESLHRQQQQQQEPTIHFAAFPQRPTIHTGEHGWCQQEREDWESVDEYEQDDESILEKIINSISFFYTRISLWFQDKKLQWQRGRPLTPRSRRIAEVPFCMATFGSIYGTFILVRAAGKPLIFFPLFLI
ncbi:hypothetical protein BDC45DRAFT_100388 [Circinella umbellata]|nr:hypothetical protein BDC45DRAFT_100388 [Circinella umbellata]